MNQIRHRLLLLLFLVLLSILALLFEFYVRAIRQTGEAEHNRLTSFFLSEELRRSTEDLYTMAKAFLTTGDSSYKKNFEEILAIRDGKLARTDSYQRTYWGYLLALNPGMSPTGEVANLVELMERNGFTQNELSKLKKAKTISDNLAAIEINAMEAVAANPDSSSERLRAHLTLSTHSFLKSKVEMLRLISEGQQMSDQRCEAAIEHSRRIAGILRLAFIVLAIALLLVGWRGWRGERRRSQILETRSNQDPLTEIANRSFLKAHLEGATHKAATGHDAVVLGMLDLNKFKDINDRLGHIRGDEVLRMVGARLHAHCREGDVVARYGGDEFVIVFVTPTEHIDSSVMRMRELVVDAFTSPLSSSFGSIHLGASLGISVFPTHAASIEDLFRTADEAMYAAKAQAGEIRIQEYPPRPMESAIEE